MLAFWNYLKKPVWREWRSAAWNTAAPEAHGDALMSQPATDDFHAKQGRSTARWLVPAPAGQRLPVYLKRHYRLDLFTRMMAFFFPKGAWSPAGREFHHLRWAKQQGIAVPEPLAVGERFGPGPQLQSYLVLRELTGYLPLHLAIPQAAEELPADRFATWKRHLIREVAAIAKRLHDAGAFHKDLYLCHFYVPADSVELGEVQSHSLVLIDLHRLKRHQLINLRWRIKDLAELSYSSLLPGITARDRLRFYRHYHGDTWRSWAARLLGSFVSAKAARYARHNADEVRRLNTPRPKSMGQRLPLEGVTS